MTTDEMKDRKTALGLTNEMIAEAADIPLSTVQKIMSGATKAPRKVTLVAIEAVLREEERRRRETPEPAPGRNYTYDYVPLRPMQLRPRRRKKTGTIPWTTTTPFRTSAASS